MIEETLNDPLWARLSDEWALILPPVYTQQELTDALAVSIQALIRDDFPKLIQLLYRLDIDESRLRSLLKEQPEADAGQIIAALIIERQIAKIRVRRAKAQHDPPPSPEDAW